MIGYDWYNISADGGETWTTQYITEDEAKRERHDGYIVEKANDADNLNLQDFKDVHKGKSAVEKLRLLIITYEAIAAYTEEKGRSKNIKNKEYYCRQADGLRPRVIWLYEEIKFALTAKDANSNANAAESVAIAANAVVSGKSDKMDVEY